MDIGDTCLVGENKGEFGGAVAVINPTTKVRQTLIRGVHPIAFFRAHGSLVAVEGLEHLSSSSGSVILIDHGTTGWIARVVATVPSMPVAIGLSPGGDILLRVEDARVCAPEARPFCGSARPEDRHTFRVDAQWRLELLE
jgi:hypothetical protein